MRASTQIHTHTHQVKSLIRKILVKKSVVICKHVDITMDENSMDFRRTACTTPVQAKFLFSFVVELFQTKCCSISFARRSFQNQRDKNNMYWLVVVSISAIASHRIDTIVYIEIDRHFIPMELRTYFFILLCHGKKHNDMENESEFLSHRSFEKCVSTIHIFRRVGCHSIDFRIYIFVRVCCDNGVLS